MYNIYFNDNVNESNMIFAAKTLDEAKAWIESELKGHTLVDENNQCSDDVFGSSKVARLEVYDGDPIVDGEFKDAVYVSEYFYND